MNAKSPTAADALPSRVDVLVVGAGFSGLYALQRLRQRGYRVLLVERGAGVGGVWYWNRYPGARCDVESEHYCYSFSDELVQDWDWSQRYPSQPELLAYLNHVADRFDLRPDIRLNTALTKLEWQGIGWSATTTSGHVQASFVVMATGQLSEPIVPAFEGLDTFRGEIILTSAWPDGRTDFSAQRVAVIGTGSSGAQSIPELAATAAQLTVYQRTPHYAVPAGNRPLSQDERAAIKREFPETRARARYHPSGTSRVIATESALSVSDDELELRMSELWERGGADLLTSYTDVLTDEVANERVSHHVRKRVRARIDDPVIADLLTPRGYPFGTKRLVLETDFFETFNRPNVELVDISDSGIDRISESGVIAGGVERECDVLVLATGFDAFTGVLRRTEIKGTDGSLSTVWSAGPVTYLGIMTESAPNLFFVAGAGSPSVLGNVVMSIEQHVEWIDGLLEHMRSHGHRSVRPRRAAQEAWVQRVNDAAARTLYPRAASWYMGANVEGKARNFLPFVGGLGTYRTICEREAELGYSNFEFDDPAVEDFGTKTR